MEADESETPTLKSMVGDEQAGTMRKNIVGCTAAVGKIAHLPDLKTSKPYLQKEQRSCQINVNYINMRFILLSQGW